MTVDLVALRVADALVAARVPFMLVGGFSSNYHGIPRSTKDVDFVGASPPLWRDVRCFFPRWKT